MIEKIKTHISDGELKSATEELHELVKAHTELRLLEAEVIQLSSRLNTLINEEVRGIGRTDEANMERNRISVALLTLVGKAEKKLQLPLDDQTTKNGGGSTAPTPTTPPTNKLYPIILLAIAICFAAVYWLGNTDGDSTQEDLQSSTNMSNPSGQEDKEEDIPLDSTSPFVTTWYNKNAGTNGITKISIAKNEGNEVEVEMEKRHPNRQMGKHKGLVQNNKIRLQFDHDGYRYAPTFKVNNGVLTMEMVQHKANGQLYATYNEYFGKEPPPVIIDNPTSPPFDSEAAPSQFTGVWKNINLQNGLEQITIIAGQNPGQLEITMIKVHPEKNMGTHAATLSNGKISLDFIHGGYRYMPTFTVSNDILTMETEQQHADGTPYATYQERFRKD